MPAHRLADQGELVGGLEHRLAGQRQPGGALGQFTKAQLAVAGGVAHHALGHAAVGRGHAPGLGGSGHQHGAGAGAGFAHRQPQILDARRAAGGLQAEFTHGLGRHVASQALDGAVVVGVEGQAVDHGGQVVVDRIQRRMLGAHAGPVGVQFVGQHHGQAGQHALAHLALGHHHRHGVVAGDLDPAVEHLLPGAGRQRLAAHQALAHRHQAPAHHQGGAGGGHAGGGQQELAACAHAVASSPAGAAARKSIRNRQSASASSARKSPPASGAR